MSTDPNFVVVDVDAGVPLAERQSYAAAQQRQLREDFALYWDGLGDESIVRVGTPDAPPQKGEIEIRLMRTPTQDGALGYHDCKPDGTPIIYVFVQLAQSFGDAWTAVASHEVLEVMGDPRLHLCVELDDGTVWDREICDRVEGDSYTLGGVLLSNFNTPMCFEPPTDRSKPWVYDAMNLSTAPNQVRPNGGYSQEYKTGAGWTQHGTMRPYRQALADAGISRGARRKARHKSRWRRLLARF